jgi:hypothetical protein
MHATPLDVNTTQRAMLMSAVVVKQHLAGLNLQQLMMDSASDNIFVWIKEAATSTATSTSVPIQQVHSCEVSPEAAYVCHQGGASLYFRYATSRYRARSMIDSY